MWNFRSVVNSKRSAQRTRPSTTLPNDRSNSRSEETSSGAAAGSSLSFCSAVIESVTQQDLNTACAKAVVEWLDQVAPKYRNYANLWFNRIVLIEMTGEREPALHELEELLIAWPAFSSALYRMGMVKYTQGDLASRDACTKSPVTPGSTRMRNDWRSGWQSTTTRY